MMNVSLRAGTFVAITGVALWTTTACSSAPAKPGVATLTAAAGTTASPALASRVVTPDAAKYARCMRAHGIPDFPDPVNGGFHITSSPGSDLDPGSPQFAAADTSCKAFSPEEQAGGGTANPQAQADALKYSACMRSHGLPKFPDPVFVGGSIRMAIRAGSGLDPNSPEFVAAQNACQSLQPFANGDEAPAGSAAAGGGAGSTGSSGP